MTTTPDPAIGPDPGVLWVLPSPAIPLSTRAAQLVGKEIVVHITGGMEIVGILEAVEDDLTLVLLEGRKQFDVALSSVAVIEAARGK